MSTFLITKNNLGDVDDINKARLHLGITHLSTQSPDNINITGGHVGVDTFCLYQSDVQTGAFLLSDANGCARWGTIDGSSLFTNAPISGFINDVPYATQQWSFANLLGTNNNLDDLTDPAAAISNLGLGFLFDELEYLNADTYRIMNNVSLNGLKVNEDLELIGDLIFKRSTLTPSFDNFVRINPVTNKLDVLTLANNIHQFRDGLVPMSNLIPPTTELLKQIYDDIVHNVDELKNTIVSMNEGTHYLTKSLNLLDLTDVVVARSNLGLEAIRPSSNIVELDNLTVSSTLQYTTVPDGTTLQQGMVLMCANETTGFSEWRSLPYADDTGEHGLVRIVSDYLATPNLYTQVPNMRAMRDGFDAINDDMTMNITNITDAYLRRDASFLALMEDVNSSGTGYRNILLNALQIQKANIVDFSDNQFLQATNYLSEVTTGNLGLVHYNLGIKQVATTASYHDLIDIPGHLTIISMNDSYMRRDSNLSDLHNHTMARFNLGLKDMAMMDSRDVIIEGGVVRNLTSILTSELILQHTEFQIPNFDALQNEIYLKAIDPNGTAHWSSLPYASTTQKGIVEMIESSTITSSTDPYSSLYVYDNYLRKDRNLDELVGESDLNKVRDNLGLKQLAIQDNSDVYITGGTITNMTHVKTEQLVVNTPGLALNVNMFLKASSAMDGTVEWSQISGATSTKNGLVKLALYDEQFAADSVYTSEYVKGKFDDVTSSISASLATLGDMSLQYKSAVDITGGTITGVNTVSTTGFKLSKVSGDVNTSYFLKAVTVDGTAAWDAIPSATLGAQGIVQLTNSAISISESTVFTSQYVKTAIDNVTTYVNGEIGGVTTELTTVINNVTAELNNTIANLGSMSGQNRDDVNITGGHILSESLSTKQLTLNTGNVDTSLNIFMKAITSTGVAAWASIPSATLGDQGIVQLTNGAASESTVFTSQYVKTAIDNVTMYINGEIDGVTNNLTTVINGITTGLNNTIADLGSMSSQYDNAVNITGGNISCTNVTSDLLYTNQFTLNTGTVDPSLNIFMKAATTNGVASWSQLPEADTATKGVVKIATSHLEDQSTSVFTSAQVHQNFNDLRTDIQNNSIFQNLTVTNLTVDNHGPDYVPPTDPDATITDYHKLLTLGSDGTATWLDARAAINGATPFDVHDVDLVLARGANIYSLNVYDTIQFEDVGKPTTGNPNSLLVSEGNGFMKWETNIRVNESGSGFLYNGEMEIKHDNGTMIITKKNAGGVFVPRHIFR
jgi:hypothetical protein